MIRCRCRAWRYAQLITLVLAGTATAEDNAAWPQWGGPTGDFKVVCDELSDEWPAGGPAKLWERPLGDGFSSIVAVADRLFTMYRDGDDEVVVALESCTGNTIWERRYAAPLMPEKRNGYLGHNPEYGGAGPRATPLLVDDRIYTIGYTAILHCLNQATGEVLWSRDLIREHRGWLHECGL